MSSIKPLKSRLEKNLIEKPNKFSLIGDRNHFCYLLLHELHRFRSIFNTDSNCAIDVVKNTVYDRWIPR